MVATTALTARIERRLQGLLAEVADLPSLAAEWQDLPESVQVSTALDWDHLMATYLTEVEHAYRAGAMTDEQREQYQQLRHQLRDALPLFAQLNLFRPTISLED